MDVYLIRSAEYAEAQYEEVLSFLKKGGGPVTFHAAGSLDPFEEEDPGREEVGPEAFFRQEMVLFDACYSAPPVFPLEREVASWDTLFLTCSEFRLRKNIPEDALVLLLTEVANEQNWFSALEPGNRNNGFVHTGEWQHYVRCSGAYPVAYLIASLILQRHMFTDYDGLRKHIHQWPLGCLNDFCEDKKQIILKLRTADICHDCMQLLRGKIDLAVEEQVLRIFEAVRSSMLFHQNFRQNLKPSVLRITPSGDFLLPDYNKELKLFPLEKTLYLFFLRHPEGVPLTHLVDHREELKEIYFRFTTTGELPAIHRSIQDLVQVQSGSASQKLARIGKKLRQELGEELARHYLIQGDKGEARTISLPRQYVVNELL